MMHGEAEHSRRARGIRLDLMLLQDRMDHELQLRLGECFPEAHARAAAEAHELRRARAALAAGGEPTLRIEDVGMLEGSGIAMAHVRRIKRGRSARNDVTVDGEVLEGDAWEEERARVKALHFAEERVREREVHAF